jgi:ankyrin repeat protein
MRDIQPLCYGATGDEITQFWSAVFTGNSSLAKRLIDNGVDVETINSHGSTALMLAARYGHQSIVELLIAKRVNVNFTDKHGWTALMIATQKGHQPIV